MQIKMLTPREVLEELGETNTPDDQRALLRTIKNSITGHELRKIEYIQAGLVSQLRTILSELGSEKSAEQEERNAEAADEVALWVHITSILSVIANSGTQFVAPILESDIVRHLYQGLNQTESTRVQLSILRCLNIIVDNLMIKTETGWTSDKRVADSLYTDAASKLAAIIGKSDGGVYLTQQAAQSVMALICKSCNSDRERDTLANSGVLQALCDRLVVLIRSQKVLSRGQGRPASSLNNEPQLSLLLETIVTVVENSHTRANYVANHSGLVAVIAATTQTGHDKQDLYENRAALEIPLPAVPDHYSVSAAKRSQFPPLSSSLGQKRRSSSVRTPRERMVIDEDSNQHHGEHQGEHLIVLWLLSVVRHSMGRRRFAAARLLGNLKHNGLVSSARTRSLGVLLVPILVQMLLSDIDSDLQGDYIYLVPSVLASIVRDNEYLQRAAVETKAISRLVYSLKTSFEDHDDAVVNLWWPQALHGKLTSGEPGRSLGSSGPSLGLRKKMIWRQGLLQALASIIADTESYRKEVVDIGGLSLIIQALEPFASSVMDGDNGDAIVVRGNSPDVLVAACNAIRALTRSPTALRTKLVDADVAKSIIKLLQSVEAEVRIAATMVLSNLAHDFSPMKQNIEPVLRKLCEQAHSANARLRYESLFALKAMVNGSKNELKRKIVEELGPNWIKHLVATDPHDVPAGEVIGLVPKDYRKGSMTRLSEKMDVNLGNDDEYDAHSLEEDLTIQAELLAFLRNLTTGDRPDEIIDFLLEHVGQDDFQQILLDRLKSASSQSQHTLYPTSIVSNTLYILVHLCAADKKFRQKIPSNVPLMKTVSTLLGHSDPEVRCAACWLVTNLVYVNNADAYDAVVQRARELMRLGVVNQIRRMEKGDPVMDVKERAATASECFSKLLST